MAPLCCRVCWAILRSIPVVFITSVILWSYYAYVVQMCIFTVPHIAEQVFYLAVYHPLIFMLMWCYWKTIFTPVATPPKSFQLTRADLDRLDKELSSANRREILNHAARNLPMQCRTITGEMRYCEKCKSLKPDRAHHCSVCGKCVLKMDHHCPWVNNCVCFSNYKFFILFLGYALLYCIYVAVTSVQYFVGFWTGVGDGKMQMTNLHIVFLFFAAIMFAVSLLSLFGYHCYLVAKNRSTLEAFQTPVFASGPDKEGFNLGCHRNFIEVFGSVKLLWFVPRYTSNGDGLTYPVRTVDEDYDSLLGRRQRWAEEGDNDEGSGFYVSTEIPSASQRS